LRFENPISAERQNAAHPRPNCFRAALTDTARSSVLALPSAHPLRISVARSVARETRIWVGGMSRLRDAPEEREAGASVRRAVARGTILVTVHGFPGIA